MIAFSQQMVQKYPDVTLYVKYLKSGTDNESSTFEDGEILITEDTFTYGNTTISSGETVATLVSLKMQQRLDLSHP